MEQYVIRNIIRPLHDALLYGAENAHELKDRLIFAVECAGGNWYSQQHGNLMQSYFEDYLYCDTGLQGPDMYPIRQVLCRALALDRYFYAWVEAEGALIESADAWARHHKEVCEGSIDFICMLRSLSATCYECRCPVGADEMRSVLVREKKEGNAYSREVYCVCREHLGIADNMSEFEKCVQGLAFTRKVYECPTGTIQKALANNEYMRYPLHRWPEGRAARLAAELMKTLKIVSQ